MSTSANQEGAALRRAADALTAAIAASATESQLIPLVRAVKESTPGAPRAVAEEAQTRLAAAGRQGSLEAASAAIYACGLLVDLGARVEQAFEMVVDRTAEAIAATLRLLELVEERTQAEIGEGRPPTGQRRLQILEDLQARMPVEGAASRRLGDFLAPFTDVLLASRSARVRARAIPELRANAAHFAAGPGSVENMVITLLGGLDGEFVALHPADQRGFRLEATGVTHNFQLLLLAGDALIGEPPQGLLAGRRPHPRHAAAMRDRPWPAEAPPAELPFQAQTFRAITSSGALDADVAAHWVIGAAAPADIPLLGGLPVIVLSAPSIRRTFKAPRDFDALHADVRLVAPLGAGEVQSWIRRAGAGA